MGKINRILASLPGESDQKISKKVCDWPNETNVNKIKWVFAVQTKASETEYFSAAFRGTAEEQPFIFY